MCWERTKILVFLLGMSAFAGTVTGCSHTAIRQYLNSPAARASARHLTLEQALAEVQKASVPAGIEPSLFAMLQQELVRVLQEQGRAASLAPTGAYNAVNDLLVLGNASEGWRLAWTYRNVGDYNGDGLANISDLTPLGQNFSMTRYDRGWHLAQYAVNAG